MKVDQPGSNVTASRGRHPGMVPFAVFWDVINANFPGEPGVGVGCVPCLPGAAVHDTHLPPVTRV